jgi:glycosyltransferase involved in cell wall biosynthesis
MAAVRALFLSSYTGLGGGETSLLALLGALDRARIVPLLVCPREGQLTEAARALKVDVRVIPWRAAPVWFVPAIWTRAPAVSRLLACIDEVRPAVLHTEFHALPYAVGAARRRALPVVFGCYGWWFRPRRWQRGFYRFPRLSVLAMSDAVRAGILERPGALDPACVSVVHPGVDTRVCRPRVGDRGAIRARLDLPFDRPLVTLVARFQDVKGHHVFLETARRVLRSEPRACFAIAGDNVFGGSADEGYKRRIVETVASDGALHDAVRLLGWIPRPEELMAASDVVVCSSLFESFGMVAVEAMACEVPVVSTNVGGPAETIVDGETGYLVPPQRPDLLADGVLRLLGNPDERRRLGMAGRRRVVERFSVDRYAAAVGDVLTRVAAVETGLSSARRV